MITEHDLVENMYQLHKPNQFEAEWADWAYAKRINTHKGEYHLRVFAHRNVSNSFTFKLQLDTCVGTLDLSLFNVPDDAIIQDVEALAFRAWEMFQEK
jgi:hypothetical protein